MLRRRLGFGVVIVVIMEQIDGVIMELLDIIIIISI